VKQRATDHLDEGRPDLGKGQGWMGQILFLTSFLLALGWGAILSPGEGRDGLVPFERGEKRPSKGGGGRYAEWLYQQRAYPAETIPVDAGERMREQFEELVDQTAGLLMRTADGLPAEVWVPLGPQPIIAGQTFGSPRQNVSGRISALALDPRFDGVTNQTVYIGGAQGGVWKSTDGGDSWAPLTETQSSQAVGAIAIDPQDPETLYVGLGEGSRCGLCYYGAGLLKSTNGGSSWRLIEGPISPNPPRQPAFRNAAFTRLVIDPQRPSTIYAATTFGVTAHATRGVEQLPLGQVGVWRSTDGGETWINLDPGETDGQYSAHDLVIDPRNPNRVFAAVRTIGIYRSDARGDRGSWVRISGGLPDPGATPSASPFRRAALAIGPPIPPSNENTLYAAFASGDDNLLGIWRSTDNGTTWTQTATPQRAGQANYNLDIAVHPQNSNIVYYGTSANSFNTGGTLWRSLNGGATWEDASIAPSGLGGLHADTHRIVFSQTNPPILYTGNDGGMWRTTLPDAPTLAWRQLNDTLSLTQFVSMALHPTNPALVIGGTQDNGTNRYRGAIGWDHIADGDGGAVIIDQSNPTTVYHTYFNVNNSNGPPQIGPRVSFLGGEFFSWTRRGCFGCTVETARDRFNPTDRVAFYAPMAQHTGFRGATGNVVYFGTNRLYRTANQAETWTGLGPSNNGFGTDLTKASGSSSVITTIAAHPTLDQTVSPPGETVWVGTGDGLVHVTTNAGALANATWTNVTRAPLPNRFVTGIALDPTNSQRAIITYSGFSQNTPTTPGHVFLTTNRGQSWVNISGNLPDVPVTCIAMHPTNLGTLYIGTDLGVFRTQDNGSTWVHLGEGMPKVATFALQIHPAGNQAVYAATHGRGIYRLAAPAPLTTVNAASYRESSIAAEAIVSGFGRDLAGAGAIARSLPLPTTLSGTRVAVQDRTGAIRYAPLFFVSENQINFKIPPGTELGRAVVTVTSGTGSVALGTVEVESVAPSLFSANADGVGVPAGYALRFGADGSQVTLPISRTDVISGRSVPLPIDLGSETDQTYLVLFGTGLRNNSATAQALVGGLSVPIPYLGPQGTFLGLDQVNLLLPRVLKGGGGATIQLTTDGRASNPLTIEIQ
jgi:uncharacterized protein (TIGR03437 family)